VVLGSSQAPIAHIPATPHAVPSGSFRSAPQSGAAPSQFSGVSQLLAAGLQTVFAGETASPGQTTVVPSHFSSTSHDPAAGRQTVALD
jgi:hypothetical protein